MLWAGSATAADLPDQAAPRENPANATPDWTGVYAGGSVGAASDRIDGNYIVAPTANWSTTASPGLFGGQAGIQKQSGSVVTGVDFSAAGLFHERLQERPVQSHDILRNWVGPLAAVVRRTFDHRPAARLDLRVPDAPRDGRLCHRPVGSPPGGGTVWGHLGCRPDQASWWLHRRGRGLDGYRELGSWSRVSPLRLQQPACQAQPGERNPVFQKNLLREASDRKRDASRGPTVQMEKVALMRAGCARHAPRQNGWPRLRPPRPS